MSNEVKLNVDVDSVIRAEVNKTISEALSKSYPGLMQDIITKALNEKADYGRETKFNLVINEMIRGSAEESFKLWIDKNKVKIAEEVEKRLVKNPATFAKAVADKILEAMVKNLYIKVEMKVERE